MSTLPPELAALPPPDIIEPLDAERIIAEMMADVVERFARDGVNYDVGGLETDTVKVMFEAASYRELLLRARVNDAARANLLSFAEKADLDHLAGFYDVVRLDGETDAALRSRTVLAIKARSPGGSSYWYAAAARRADVRIRDVAVYREEFMPIIHIAILSSENDGIPDDAMLDAVRAEVTSDTVRLLNDTLIVEPAVTRTVDIEADIWLLPDASQELVADLAAKLRAAWNVGTGIGFDLERSWIESRLHVGGVKRVDVTSPDLTVIAQPGTAIALGSVTINDRGRDY